MSLNFGQALEHLKAGGKVARVGWNGKGMWLALCRGYPEGVAPSARAVEELGVEPEGTIRILPYIMMRTADGSFVPWLASQTDLLAEDWTRG